MRWHEWVFLVSWGITGIALLVVVIHSYKTFIELSKVVKEIKGLLSQNNTKKEKGD